MNKENINRRNFLKVAGLGSAATTVALYGCNTNSPIEETPSPKLIGEMTYRQFPSLGDKVSILGYGCMRWPTLQTPASNGNVVDQETVNKLIDYAFEHGVNYVDTAPVYMQGWCEESTGIALKRYPREQFFLAAKCSNFAGTSFEEGVEMYHNSFKKLQVDYIDYYLLHNIGSIDQFNNRFLNNGLVDYFVKEREAGRIRHLGWSFHGNKQTFDYILSFHEQYHWDFVQIQLNYSDWNNGSDAQAEYLYNELYKRNIPVVIMEPLLGGRLSNVPEHIFTRLKERNNEGSVASWAFRFAGSLDGVLTVLSGMTYMEHLQDNVKTLSPLEVLTEEENDFLLETAQLMRSYPTIPCNDCKYCMPCPYGLDIPAILLHYNKCITEGNVATGPDDENYAKARRAFLIGYDRSVPKLRQADRCSGCDQCSPHCPQRIRIPQQLQRIDRYVESLRQNK